MLISECSVMPASDANILVTTTTITTTKQQKRHCVF